MFKYLKTQIKTHFELARISNIGTVFSNTLLGYALSTQEFQLIPLLLLVIASTFFYIAGMYQNDYMDYQWDTIHKNDRPLTQGKIKPSTVRKFYLSYFLVGLVLYNCVNMINGFSLIGFVSAIILIICICIYNIDHKDNKYSPMIMGLCRGMLVMTVSLSLSIEINIYHFLFFLVYVFHTSLLTYIAKFEYSSSQGIKKLFKLLFILNLFLLTPLLEIPVSLISWMLLLCFLTYNTYHFNKHSIGHSVTNLIAAMILIDAILLVTINPYFLILSLVMFFGTLTFQKIIKGT